MVEVGWFLFRYVTIPVVLLALLIVIGGLINEKRR